MTKVKLLTVKEFNVLLPELRKQLMGALTKEQEDCALPDPTTDLWDLPPVDSKTVAKLSPVVKAITGHRLRPSWIRKGGYDSIEDAVHDLIGQVRAHCVLGGGLEGKSNAVPVTLAM